MGDCGRTGGWSLWKGVQGKINTLKLSDLILLQKFIYMVLFALILFL